MIFEKTSLKMSLNFILLTSLYLFQSPVFNAMPFMYYRADLSCKIDGEWKLCKEQEICENGYEFEYVNKNGIESLTMDYGLVCEKRLSEATILSIGFFGGLFAFILAVCFEIPKNRKTNIIFLLALIEGLCLNSLAIIKDNLVWVTIVIFIWNFGFSFVYSQIYAYSAEMYTPAIQKKAVSLINIAWTSGALIYIGYSQITFNWIDHVAYFSGSTVWIGAILFKLTSSSPHSLSKLDTPLQASERNNIQLEEEVQKQTQLNFFQDLSQKFKSLRKNNTYLFNTLVFVSGWFILQASYATPFIAFNALGGDLWTNVFISILFDFFGSIISYYFLSKFDAFYLLVKNIQIIGIIQTVSILFPLDSYTLQIIPILATKLSTRIGFPTILTLLLLILPYQYNQLVFNLGNVIQIGLSSLLPFYRYMMEYNNLNIFFGIGLISLAYLPMLLKCKRFEDEIEIKSTKFFRKESYSSPQKNLDAIMEATLKKQSIIALKDPQIKVDQKASFDKQNLSQLKGTPENITSQGRDVELKFISQK